MKVFFLTGLLLATPYAQAQWGGVLDPNIMRQAGEAAATGNIMLGNVQIDGAPMQEAPTASDIAEEIRAQEQRAQIRRRLAERDARRARVIKVIEQAYQAEFKQ